MSGQDWQVFEIEDLRGNVRGPEPRFFEFLAGQRLSGAVYRLPAGAHDLQGPHLEDEVYVVLRGRATLRVGAVDRAIHPGLVVFIPTNVAHSFVDITEDLELLALFSATKKPYA
ncbi:MAG: cupin domain-containing protein [Gammaproteobacteria bacterium]|nr:cupin domain-containing protein [Gammaproteobacteria bacterium]